jgi:Transcriptional Coactivator p15 (PC4)
MSPRPTLAAPVTVSKFWKNRAHDAIITTLEEYEGRVLVDVRQHVMSNGRLVPTPRGISIVVLRRRYRAGRLGGGSGFAHASIGGSNPSLCRMCHRGFGCRHRGPR